MIPVGELTREDRSLIRRILDRRQGDPMPGILALSQLQEIALRYEVRLSALETLLDDALTRLDAKGTALDELRQVVAEGHR